jgi:hypothetical protein
VDEEVEIPLWLCYWLETIREYDDKEANRVEELCLPHNHGKTHACYVLRLF